MAGVNKYKDGVVSRLFKGLTGLIKGRGITVIEGEGRLVGADTVEVDGRRYDGGAVVLASGSYSRSLPGLEVDGERVLTSEHALQLDRVPASVVVLGGGVIGCEFASVWRSFGAEVTIVEALPRLVAAEDEAVSKALERAFRSAASASWSAPRSSASSTPTTGVARHRRRRRDPRRRPAAGRGRPRPADRRPRLRGAGHHHRPRLRAHRRALPHQRRGRLRGRRHRARPPARPPRLRSRASSSPSRSPGSSPTPIDEAGIPRVTYCDPEVASVGLTEAQRRATYGDDEVETLTYDLGGNGKSQILKTQGFVKLVRRKDGPVVGVHMVGARVGELSARPSSSTTGRRYPEDVAAAGPRPPDPERGPRRGAPGAGRQAAARALIDSTDTQTSPAQPPTTRSEGTPWRPSHPPGPRRVRHRRHRHPLAEAGG